MPSNYANCVSRLKSQIGKLQKEPKLLEECDNIIREQEEAGIIEKVNELPSAEKVYYMPNQIVVRENAETTKVRMVFDASSKSGKRGTSLNDCLHVGPPLNPMLFDILTRFRENNVAVVGDIEKAFLNVEIDEADRDCLRFLWVENIHDEEISPVIFHYNRAVFGVSSSPFLLNAVIRNHMEKFRESDPEFATRLSQNFFVDDLCTGAKDLDAAKELFEKSRERMLQAGFKLRKWKSNDAELRYYMEGTSRNQEGNGTDAKSEVSYAKETLNAGQQPEKGKTKVLGLIWDVNTDELEIDLTKMSNEDSGKVTKRSLLSSLAKVFDPLGLVSPVTLMGKILFQELCIDKKDWDEELPAEKKERWETLLRDAQSVKSVTVPRTLHEPEGDKVKYSLHGFGDASIKAYSTVVYLVTETETGKYAQLICSKTRIAPLKGLTIPRLELMSARILATLMDTVKNSLAQQIEISEVRYWLDSKTALHWIYNAGEWKQFVQQRVNKILRLSDKESWSHCPGKENPTDLGSRGELASTLVGKPIWWEGPVWLSQGEEFWPKCTFISESVEVLSEKKKSSVVLTAVESSPESLEQVIEISRFNSFTRLVRVTAMVQRFIKNCRMKGHANKARGAITSEEMQTAEDLWIRNVQLLFSGEKGKRILKSLGAYEENGLIRCKGRLENADLEFDTRNPIVLPRDHRLTELIIQDCHNRVKHLKVRSTLAEVRTKYWIPRGRQLVKKILHRCKICIRHEGKPYNTPTTAALPEFRAQASPPFAKVGLDFAGPLFVRGGKRNMSKVYIALFTCAVTRAVHLELVQDMSVDVFLRSFRRFVSRRGSPTMVVSDNAKTFKLAAKLLGQLKIDDNFLSYLQGERIFWRFNLERSSWWGGFFERMVGTVKRCLKKVIGKARLDYDELQTILIEVESIVNSRPLTYVYDELESEPLTPSHLLYGRRLAVLPDKRDPEHVDRNVNFSKRYRYLVTKISHF